MCFRSERVKWIICCWQTIVVSLESMATWIFEIKAMTGTLNCVLLDKRLPKKHNFDHIYLKWNEKKTMLNYFNLLFVKSRKDGKFLLICYTVGNMKTGSLGHNGYERHIRVKHLLIFCWKYTVCCEVTQTRTAFKNSWCSNHVFISVSVRFALYWLVNTYRF